MSSELDRRVPRGPRPRRRLLGAALGPTCLAALSVALVLLGGGSYLALWPTLAADAASAAPGAPADSAAIEDTGEKDADAAAGDAADGAEGADGAESGSGAMGSLTLPDAALTEPDAVDGSGTASDEGGVDAPAAPADGESGSGGASSGSSGGSAPAPAEPDAPADADPGPTAAEESATYSFLAGKASLLPGYVSQANACAAAFEADAGSTDLNRRLADQRTCAALSQTLFSEYLAVRDRPIANESAYKDAQGELIAMYRLLGSYVGCYEDAWTANVAYEDPTGHEAEYRAPLASAGSYQAEFQSRYQGFSL